MVAEVADDVDFQTLEHSQEPSVSFFKDTIAVLQGNAFQHETRENLVCTAQPKCTASASIPPELLFSGQDASVMKPQNVIL